MTLQKIKSNDRIEFRSPFNAKEDRNRQGQLYVAIFHPIILLLPRFRLAFASPTNKQKQYLDLSITKFASHQSPRQWRSCHNGRFCWSCLYPRSMGDRANEIAVRCTHNPRWQLQLKQKLDFLRRDFTSSQNGSCWKQSASYPVGFDPSPTNLGCCRTFATSNQRSLDRKVLRHASGCRLVWRSGSNDLRLTRRRAPIFCLVALKKSCWKGCQPPHHKHQTSLLSLHQTTLHPGLDLPTPLRLE